MKKKVSAEEVSRLRESYLFSSLEPMAFEDVLSFSKAQEFEEGDSVIRQEEVADSFFWVSAGMARLYRYSESGEEKVIDLVRSGSFFAEAALFMGGKYPVSAAMQAKGRLIVFDGTQFRAWLRQDVDRCFRLLAGVAVRMHGLVRDIERLTLLKGEDRLRQYFLDHAQIGDRGERLVTLPATKRVIASQIGIKPETFSRLLHKMTVNGDLVVRGSCIYLQDSPFWS